MALSLSPGDRRRRTLWLLPGLFLSIGSGKGSPREPAEGTGEGPAFPPACSIFERPGIARSARISPHGAPTLALGLNFPFTIPAFYDTNEKAAENIGFQTARQANFLRSTRNKFDNCTGGATNKKSAAIAAGFVFSGAGRTCSPERMRRQNGSDEVGTGFYRGCWLNSVICWKKSNKIRRDSTDGRAPIR